MTALSVWALLGKQYAEARAQGFAAGKLAAKKESDREDYDPPPDEDEVEPGDDAPQKKGKKKKAKNPVEDEPAEKDPSEPGKPDRPREAASFPASFFQSAAEPNDDAYWHHVRATADGIIRMGEIRRGAKVAGMLKAAPIMNEKDYPRGYAEHVAATAKAIVEAGRRRRGEI